MGVDMYSALSMHEVSERKSKEGNVGAFAPLVDVESPDVTVVVDVMRNEESSLKRVKYVTRWCGED